MPRHLQEILTLGAAKGLGPAQDQRPPVAMVAGQGRDQLCHGHRRPAFAQKRPVLAGIEDRILGQGCTQPFSAEKAVAARRRANRRALPDWSFVETITAQVQKHEVGMGLQAVNGPSVYGGIRPRLHAPAILLGAWTSPR